MSAAKRSRQGIGAAAADVVYALRLIRRTPVSSLIVILVLALGIGAGTAVFSVINNTLLRPMLLADVERLVRIDEVNTGPDGTGTETNAAPLTAEQLRSGTSTLAHVTVQDARWHIIEGDEPERVRGAGVSGSWHETLGVEPLLGRRFTEEELRAGASSGVVLIGHELWSRRFGRSTSVIGSTIQLEQGPHTIVGVMPRGFRFPYEAELWTPIDYDAQSTARYLLVFARMQEGAQLPQVQQELNAVQARLHVDTDPDSPWQLRAQPLRDNLVRGADRTAFALLATVAFLLIIACVNVAALMLARVTGRRDEMVVRGALGASRAQLVRLVVMEAFTFTVIAAGAGLLLARVFAPVLGALVPPVMSVELAQNEIALDMRVLAFAALLTLCAVAVAGVIPALRGLPLDLQSALRQSARSGGGRSGRRWVRTLIAGEVALALVLLVGAAGVILGFTQSSLGAPGYDAEDVVTARLTLGSAYAEHDARVALLDDMTARMSAVPGVSAVAATTTSPRLPSWSAAFAADDVPDAEPVETQLVVVTPGWFDAMRTRIIDGRALDASDRMSTAPVAVISQRTADLLWPGERAVGKRLRFPGAPEGTGPEVIGVSEDVRWASEPAAAVYLAWAQSPFQQLTSEVHVMLRMSGAAEAQLTAVRQQLAAAAPRAPLSAVTLLDDMRSPDYLLERTGAVISAAFAVLGTAIAMLGIFGALSFAVTRARRELAVRQALGATPSSILSLQLREISALIFIGTLCGAAGGAALNRVLRHFLADAVVVPATAYGALIAIVLVLGALAACAPAVRAARTDPMHALRG